MFQSLGLRLAFDLRLFDTHFLIDRREIVWCVGLLPLVFADCVEVCEREVAGGMSDSVVNSRIRADRTGLLLPRKVYRPFREYTLSVERMTLHGYLQ